MGLARTKEKAKGTATASPMPFGSESAWDTARPPSLPRSKPSGHQCLSAVSPLGTRHENFRLDPVLMRSPMPFGSESAWDQRGLVSIQHRHRSSPMPFGSESAWDAVSWRHAVPRDSGRHQCLSAVSPLGTGEEFAKARKAAGLSPMPFGSESAWDGWRRR